MHSVSDPSRVRFSGPLAPYASAVARELAGLGYAPTSAANQLQLAAHLSRWLEAAGLGVGDLSEEVIDTFLVDPRRDYANHYSIRALGPLLAFLRSVGVAPAALAVEPAGEIELVLDRFRRHLLVERAVSGPVAVAYVRWVRPFVAAVSVSDPGLTFTELDAAMVCRFLVGHLPGLPRKTAQMTACALRSFLRFLHAEGLAGVDLAPAVPPFAFWRLSGVPRSLTDMQVASLVGACDPADATGLRDRTVIACMVRLGLRCGEVAALSLDDLSWASGTLRVRGKGGRIDVLPLPVDVGEQLVAYLRHGRPTRAADRAVFVAARAPFTALAPNSVSCIIGRAARRAGLGTVHAHRLRHTAATRTLNAGATLEQVAQLLRHASPTTTAVYAKTDVTRLASIARPWPIGGSAS